MLVDYSHGGGGGCPFGAGILGKGVILWLSWCHAGDLGIVIKFYY